MRFPRTPIVMLALSTSAVLSLAQRPGAEAPAPLGVEAVQTPLLIGAESAPAQAVAEATIPEAPAPVGMISGTAMDAYGGILPGASIILQGPGSADRLTAVANESGFFQIHAVKPGVVYRASVTANGYGEWRSDPITIAPGQALLLTGIALKMQTATSSVTVYGSTQQIAVQQVQLALDQRVLGIVPNFYVLYDSKNAAPLPVKQKFRLALRTMTDPMAFVAAGFIAGVNQGFETPSYELGSTGYGKRFGAAYADNSIDVLFGGAILPAIFHQDPRYYYQGTGTGGSRFWHAVSYPFICQGDNGRKQINISTIGGDAAAAGFSNLYYPKQDRGLELVWVNLAVGTVERMASTLAQEFILSRFTHRGGRD